MKSKFGLSLVLGVSAALVACAPVEAQQPMKENIKQYDVFLKVDEKTLSIEKRGDTKCESSPNQLKAEYGCVTVAKGDQAIVHYELQSNDWYIAEMTICKGETKEKQVCKLDEKEREEFSVMEVDGLNRYHPNAGGVIDFGKVAKQVSAFKLINLNSFKGDYFYSIKACDADKNCVITDPPIKNGGGHG